MTRIGLSGVSVRYELLTVRDYNLKRQVVTSARGRGERRLRTLLAIDDVTLDIPAGVRLGLVGVNGAGKSTLLSVIANVLAPSTGQVWVEGRLLPLLGSGGAGLDVEASGVTNVLEMGIMLGEAPRAMEERLPEIADFSGLGDRLTSPMYTYSTGMVARLRFSVITALRPDILVVDEGIGMADAEFTERSRARLEQFYGAAGILVMASHSEPLLQAHCTHGLWLHQGRIMLHASIAEVLREYRGFSADESAKSRG